MLLIIYLFMLFMFVFIAVFMQAEEIVTYVKQALMDSIDKNTIMDAATKATAKTKVMVSSFSTY